MWARIIEMMTAVWLAFSPFIFRATDDPQILWGDLGAALMIVGAAGFSYWKPLKYAHWGILLVAIGLIIEGRFIAPPPASPAHQNHIFIGLFLLMIAIVPNEASLPPPSWRCADSGDRC